MNRKLIALLPWMVAATAASWAQTQPAEVRYLAAAPLRSGVVRLADECFVSTTTPQAWGWKITIKDGVATAEYAGRRVQAPVRLIGGKPALPLRALTNKLGGYSEWDDSRNVLRIFSKVVSAKLDDGKLEVQLSFPVKPAAFTLNNPHRLVIDLSPVILDSSVVLQTDQTGRVAQFKEDTVRVVVAVDEEFRLDTHLSDETDRVNLSFDKPAAPVEPPTGEEPQPNEQDPAGVGGLMPAPKQKPAVQPPDATPTTPTPDASALPANDSGFSIDRKTEGSVLLVLKLTKPISQPATFDRSDPFVLNVSLPGAKLDASCATNPAPDMIDSISLAGTPGAQSLCIKLAKPLGVEVTLAGQELQVFLITPTVSDGRIAGKVVVIDPGHGGHDTGARSPDGTVDEKDLVLAIGKQLSSKLTAAGATVVMTRKTDDFIALDERSAMSNRDHAALYVSIHVNALSLDRAAGVRGSMTFYHGDDPIGALLATCVQHQIAKSTAVPSIGVRSDLTRFQNGMAVLRNTHAPAILIETGFITNADDRAKLQDPAYQATLVDAIVAGLKEFFGDKHGQS